MKDFTLSDYPNSRDNLFHFLVYLRKITRSIGIFVFLGVFLVSFNTFSQVIIEGTVPVQTPTGGFGVDGDAFAGTPAPDFTDVGDWFFADPSDPNNDTNTDPGGLFQFDNVNGTLIPLYDNTFFQQDDIPMGKTKDRTIFTTDAKIDHDPNTYTWGEGSSPPKNEIQNVAVHFTYGDASLSDDFGTYGNPDDLWALFGADRAVNNGDSYIDFEFLQASLTMTGIGTGSGGFESDPSTAATGGRTIGDLLITVGYGNGGGVATVAVFRWSPDGSGGYYYALQNLSNYMGMIYATTNTSISYVPFDAYGKNYYEVNQWVEGAVNLSGIFEENLDPCIELSTLFVRTRSSGESGTAQLKDFPLEPIQLHLDLTPQIAIGKTDVSCNGVVDGAVTVTSASGYDRLDLYKVVGNPDDDQNGEINDTKEDSNTDGSIFSGLSPGSYYVIAIKESGAGDCPATSNVVTIIEPDAVTLSASHTNVSCNGVADGTLTIDSFSGTGTPSFYLKTGAGDFVSTTEAAIEAGSYGPGTYVIKVTYPDGNNSGVCEKTETEIITEPDAVTLSASHTNVSCNGVADGTLTIDSFSGTGTPSFYLKTGAGDFVSTTEAAIEAGSYGPGTYVIKVTYPDGNNSGVCEKTETEIITEPDAVTLSASHTNVSCNGVADGTLTIDSFSGTGTPSFYLKTGAGDFVSTTEAAIEAGSYGPGTYVIKVTYPDGDNSGVCEKTETETITEPDAVTLSASHTNVSCNGVADGTLTIDSFSGTGTPSFYLKTGAGDFVSTTEAAIEAGSYGPGTYVIKVTYPDGNNSGVCEKTETEIITEPDAVTLSASHTNVSCNGVADGTLTIDSFSGTGTPSFYLKTGAGDFVSTTEAAIEAGSYGPGTYVIKVTYPDGDNSGVCEKTETETITEPDAVTLSASHTNVSCNGVADGTLTIDSFSGTGTPSFYLKTGAGDFVSTTKAAIEAGSYGPGTYVIKVTYPDGNNSGVCEKTETEIITEPDAFSASATGTDESCAYNDGSIDVTLTNGVGPFDYDWDDDSLDGTQDPTGLSAGTYNVTITDANGCKAYASFTVNAPGNCITDEGCTPGYWKNHTDAWVGAHPDDNFFTHFGITYIGNNVQDITTECDLNHDGQLTLLEAISAEVKTSKNNGWFAALARHAVAAFLNASNPDVGYEFSTSYILAQTKLVFETDYPNRNQANAAARALHDMFRTANERVCPLGNETSSTLADTSVLRLSESTVEIQAEELNQNTTDVNGFNVSPVPFRESLSVQYDFDYVSSALIQIFDMQGRLLLTQKEANASQGKITDLNINFRIMPSQVYVIKVTTDRDVFTKKIISDK